MDCPSGFARMSASDDVGVEQVAGDRRSSTDVPESLLDLLVGLVAEPLSQDRADALLVALCRRTSRRSNRRRLRRGMRDQNEDSPSAAVISSASIRSSRPDAR